MSEEGSARTKKVNRIAVTFVVLPLEAVTKLVTTQLCLVVSRHSRESLTSGVLCIALLLLLNQSTAVLYRHSWLKPTAGDTRIMLTCDLLLLT